MKYIYIILIILLVYAGFAYLRFKYILSRAHLPEFVQTDQTLGQGPTLRYIAAGDSTAFGEGASSVQNTYPYKIAQYFSASHTVQYKNVAVQGAMTEDLINSQLEQIIAFQPDVITISIGANDITHLHSDSTVLANDKTIINTLVAKTNAIIYITDVPNFSGANLLPWALIQLLEYKTKTLNPQILALGSDRVKIIDIHSVPTTVAADHFHPNDVGYQNWTNAFLDQIKNN